MTDVRKEIRKISIILDTLVEERKLQLMTAIKETIKTCKQESIDEIIEPHINELEDSGFEARVIYETAFIPEVEKRINNNLIADTVEEIDSSMQNLLFVHFIKLGHCNAVEECVRVRDRGIRSINDYFDEVYNNIFIEPEMSISEMVRETFNTLIPLFDMMLVIKCESA